MLRLLFSFFLVLHGLVYLWYFTLSQRLVVFQPEMGWSGRSWLFSNLLGDATLRTLASLLYVLATLGFVAGGLGLFSQQVWWRPLVLSTAAFATVIILLFWDGSLQLVVQKGVIGLLINLGLLLVLLSQRWPTEVF
jgi:hypothetical protein